MPDFQSLSIVYQTHTQKNHVCIILKYNSTTIHITSLLSYFLDLEKLYYTYYIIRSVSVYYAVICS